MSDQQKAAEEQVLKASQLGLQFFDRLDLKGSELQAAMQVRGLLEGLASGQLLVSAAQQNQPEMPPEG
jgi:hypothetical protein